MKDEAERETFKLILVASFVLVPLCTLCCEWILRAMSSLVACINENGKQKRELNDGSRMCAGTPVSSEDMLRPLQYEDIQRSARPITSPSSHGAMHPINTGSQNPARRQDVTIEKKVEVWRVTEHDARQYRLLWYVLVFWVWFDRVRRKAENGMVKDHIQPGSALNVGTTENMGSWQKDKRGSCA